MIKVINGVLDTKAPYVRRNYTKTTRIRTVIREEPIQLAQYIRGKSSEFNPYSIDLNKHTREREGSFTPSQHVNTLAKIFIS